jgi:hypothetical protein
VICKSLFVLLPWANKVDIQVDIDWEAGRVWYAVRVQREGPAPPGSVQSLNGNEPTGKGQG